jgi:hypothetical protein
MQSIAKEIPNRVVLSQNYDPVIKSAVAQQILFAVLAILTLDGGQTARNLACCIAAFWLAVAMIAIRRPSMPTAADLAIIKWGSLPLTILAYAYR